MWDLFRTGNYPIFGVFMGKEELRWPLNDIAEHRKAFASQFEQYCAEKKPLYLKVILFQIEFLTKNINSFIYILHF